MPQTADEKETWNWLGQADLKVEGEVNLKVEVRAMLFALQEQAVQTNYVKQKIDKTAQSQICRMCDGKSETISLTVRECEKLAQKEYKRR